MEIQNTQRNKLPDTIASIMQTTSTHEITGTNIFCDWIKQVRIGAEQSGWYSILNLAYSIIYTHSGMTSIYCGQAEFDIEWPPNSTNGYLFMFEGMAKLWCITPKSSSIILCKARQGGEKVKSARLNSFVFYLERHLVGMCERIDIT